MQAVQALENDKQHYVAINTHNSIKYQRVNPNPAHLSIVAIVILFIFTIDTFYTIIYFLYYLTELFIFFHPFKYVLGSWCKL